MPIFLLSFLMLLFSTNLYAQTAGCVNGKLQDPKAWFFNHINRPEGSSANDWAAILRNSGLQAGPAPGVKAGPQNFGITQQLDGAGNPRSRVFLPTDIADSLGYFTRVVDTLADGAGGLVWSWFEASTPPYAPRVCDSIIVVPVPPVDNHEDIYHRLDQLDNEVRALKVMDANLDIKLTDVDNRVKFLEARPFYNGCEVIAFSFRARCSLTK